MRNVLRSSIVVALILAGIAPLARAQHRLMAEYQGKPHVVRHVQRNRPYVEVNDKRVEASRQRYWLPDAEEYDPFYVSVRRVQVIMRSVELLSEGKHINQRLEFKASLQSAYPLRNVFLVLDMSSDDTGRSLYVQEVGQMEANAPKVIDVSAPVHDAGAGHFRLHVFVDGAEIFHSEMPMDYIERTLDAMIRKRIGGVTNALPRPFVGPAPEVPAKLRTTAGRAIVRLTVSPNGRVLEPSVSTATHPEFGEAALAAVRHWRFLPRIVSSKPVAAVIEMPFIFGKPAATEGPGRPTS